MGFLLFLHSDHHGWHRGKLDELNLLLSYPGPSFKQHCCQFLIFCAIIESLSSPAPVSIKWKSVSQPSVGPVEIDLKNLLKLAILATLLYTSPLWVGEWVEFWTSIALRLASLFPSSIIFAKAIGKVVAEPQFLSFHLFITLAKPYYWYSAWIWTIYGEALI